MLPELGSVRKQHASLGKLVKFAAAGHLGPEHSTALTRSAGEQNIVRIMSHSCLLLDTAGLALQTLHSLKQLALHSRQHLDQKGVRTIAL